MRMGDFVIESSSVCASTCRAVGQAAAAPVRRAHGLARVFGGARGGRGSRRAAAARFRPGEPDRSEAERIVASARPVSESGTELDRRSVDQCVASRAQCDVPLSRRARVACARRPRWRARGARPAGADVSTASRSAKADPSDPHQARQLAQSSAKPFRRRLEPLLRALAPQSIPFASRVRCLGALARGSA
jgi:hypothetical protein